MTSLADFLEDVNLPNGEKHEVYCMDGSEKSAEIPDMRKHVGLGECNCCDYFLIRGNKIVIIEETKLAWTIKRLGEEYPELKGNSQKKFIIDSIRLENYAKVYGSLLVLCCLIRKCKEAAERMGCKKYDFWLVSSDKESEEVKTYFDYLRDHLYSQLRGALSKTVIHKVKIIPSRTQALTEA